MESGLLRRRAPRNDLTLRVKRSSPVIMAMESDLSLRVKRSSPVIMAMESGE